MNHHHTNNGNNLPSSNGHFSSSSSNNSSPASSRIMPSSSNDGSHNFSAGNSANNSLQRGKQRFQFGNQFRNAMQDKMLNDPMASNMRELQDKMTEMNNIKAGSLSGSAGSGSAQHITVTESSSSKFNRSLSTSAGLKIPSQTHQFKRHETSPAIVEQPSQSPTDSLEENGNGPFPIVTSPVSDLTELTSADLQFSDNESISGGGLTSPNLVSTTGRGLPLVNSCLSPSVAAANHLSNRLNSMATLGNSASMFSHEERKTSSSSKTKIVTDKASTEKATTTGTQMKRMQAGDLSYEEKATASASKARLETSDGTVAEKSSGMKHHSARLMSGDMMHQESNLSSMSGAKIQGNSFGFENLNQASSSSRTSVSGGRFTHQMSHQSSSKKISVTRSSSLLNANEISQLMNTNMSIEELEKGLMQFDDLECLTPTTNVKNVENALVKYCGIMSNSVKAMKKDGSADSLSDWMSKLNDMMTKAWEVPSFGHDMGNTLCDILRNNGGLDLLIHSCVSDHRELQYNSAKLLQQCLVTENRGYVVDKGLDKVVEVAKNYTTDIRDVKKSRVGTGILEHLFKHSETTCGDVIAMGWIGHCSE